MDPRPSTTGTGPTASLRSLGATLVALIGARVELLVLELREEGERRKELLVLAAVGGLFLALGLLLAAFFVVVLFWDSHRLAAIGAITLLYLGVAAWAFLRLKEKVRKSPPPFEATLAEFASDLEVLRGRGE